jgi:hypothetical protein
MLHFFKTHVVEVNLDLASSVALLFKTHVVEVNLDCGIK